MSQHFKKWVEDSGIDYYTYFIKAWIAFNSWYQQKYGANRQFSTERAIINEIKRSSNDFSNAIENYIEGTGDDSDNFRAYLASLCKALQDCTIENGEERISFSQIVIETNRYNQVNENHRGIRYFIERDDSNNTVRVVVENSNGTSKYFLDQASGYSIEEIKSHRQWNGLTSAQQEQLEQNYHSINPRLPINLIRRPHEKLEGQSFDERNYYECGSFDFVRNQDSSRKADSITKGLIEILYRLRNALFHGELDPSGDTMEVYKYTYLIMKMLIVKMR
ncbi:hypothetical protein [Flagellimonas sp. S3867]|uniref:hypothetical protein n=1 Tax=Flagellimonas sp. S3867 TaxID=2768063 RepID=UPI001681DD0F|nr:hypothetical protein [Flagellimonas sp. S3867]